MTKDEALKLALEALGNWFRFDFENFGEVDYKAVAAIKEALAQPEQEPWSNVGIGVDVTKEGVSVVGIYKISNDSSHLFYSQFYSTPSKTPLTDEEVNKLVDDEDWYNDPHGFVRAIEAKLKEKNGL